MELAGKKVRLRSLRTEDLQKMIDWNRDAEVQYFVDCNLPDNLFELERWFSDNVPDRHYRIFAIETFASELIGDLELDHICWSKQEAELRIRIGEKKFWGKGFGTEAIQIILDYLFYQKNFKRIYLRVYHFNHRAIQCYQKNGFRQVGVLRRNRDDWKDIILMETNALYFKKAVNTILAG